MEKCRACGTKLGKPFLSLGASPLSNSYLSEAQLKIVEPTYPLDLYLCDTCYLVQLDVFEKAEKIFSHEYAYFASFSDSWLKHCKEYVDMMTKRFKIDKNWFVVEVASNDGYLLQYFKQNDIPVLGIEPAFQTAFAALKKGIPTEPVYFTTELAKKMVTEGQGTDLLIGNNVLAHNPGMNDFIEGMKILLKPHGIITMEFPHLMNMLQKIEFDTIYHEHFSYLSFHSVKKIFESHGLDLFDVDEIPTHGGSLRIYAQHAKTGSNPVSANVSNLLAKEEKNGLFKKETYSTFANEINRVKRDLLEFLINQKRNGKKIAGYGAPAKGNTLLNYCGIRTDFMDFTVDRSPMKQGKYLPGSRIPVYSPDYIREAKPDYLFILPWNIKDEVMDQMAFVREWGCKFVIAIPKLIIL